MSTVFKFICWMMDIVFTFVLVFVFWVMLASQDVARPDESWMVPPPVVTDEENAYHILETLSKGCEEWDQETKDLQQVIVVNHHYEELDAFLAERSEEMALFKQASLSKGLITPPIYKDGSTWVGSSLVRYGPIFESHIWQAFERNRPQDGVDSALTLIRSYHLTLKGGADAMTMLAGCSLLQNGLPACRALLFHPQLPIADVERIAIALDLIERDRVLLMLRVLSREYFDAQGVVNDVLVEEMNAGKGEGYAQQCAPSYFFQPNRTLTRLSNYYQSQMDTHQYMYEEDILSEPSHSFSPNLVGELLLATVAIKVSSVRYDIDRMISQTEMTRIVAAHVRKQRALGLPLTDFPEKLSDLMPDYLTDLKLDPFTGKPFEYDAKFGVKSAFTPTREYMETHPDWEDDFLGGFRAYDWVTLHPQPPKKRPLPKPKPSRMRRSTPRVQD